MYLYSGDQCHGRIKTLIRAYKQVKDHNSRSGNSHKTQQYEKELDELFGEKPNIIPKCTISSSGEKATEEENTESNSDGAAAERAEKSQKRKAKETEEGGTNVKKARKTQVSEVIDYLRSQDRVKQEKREEEQSRKEKRHEERMSKSR